MGEGGRNKKPDDSQNNSNVNNPENSENGADRKIRKKNSQGGEMR